jgi:hypothetical protein
MDMAMRWRCSIGAIAVALLGCGAAAAGAHPSLFPLGDGNRWTLHDLQFGSETTIEVRGRASGLLLRGWPGASELRVRSAGRTVEAWDPSDQRWEPLLRLGAPRGTRYLVALGGIALWRSVEVEIASREAVVRDLRERTFRGCTRLTFRQRKPVVDAGLLELVVAPGVGPVRISVQTIAGPRQSLLAAHRIRR